MGVGRDVEHARMRGRVACQASITAAGEARLVPVSGGARPAGLWLARHRQPPPYLPRAVQALGLTGFDAAVGFAAMLPIWRAGPIRAWLGAPITATLTLPEVRPELETAGFDVGALVARPEPRLHRAREGAVAVDRGDHWRQA